MLDIGGTEILVIAIATVIIVGPRELPRVLRTVTGYVRKIREVAGEFQSTMTDMANEADMADLRKELKEMADKDFEGDIDPTGSVKSTFQDLKDEVNGIKVHTAKPPGPTPQKWPPDSDSKSSNSGDVSTIQAGAPRPLPVAPKEEAKPKKAPVKKTAAKKASAKKAPAKKVAAKKTTAKKTVAKKATARKAAAKKTSAA